MSGRNKRAAAAYLWALPLYQEWVKRNFRWVPNVTIADDGCAAIVKPSVSVERWVRVVPADTAMVWRRNSAGKRYRVPVGSLQFFGRKP